MNEGARKRFDGGNVFAIEEIPVEGHQCGQCNRCRAEHGGRLHCPRLQLRKLAMLPCNYFSGGLMPRAVD